MVGVELNPIVARSSKMEKRASISPRVKAYQEHAQHCEQMARTARHADTVTLFRDLAFQWCNLAAQAESAECESRIRLRHYPVVVEAEADD
jgi:hypothetical protein